MSIHTVAICGQDLEHWKKGLELWDLTQLTEFFEDEETGQVGAICIGTDQGSVSYFRAL